MKIDELLLKKKTKKKKVKLLKEVFTERPNPIKIGNNTFYPPFYSLNERVYDTQDQTLCMAASGEAAKWLMNFLWDNM